MYIILFQKPASIPRSHLAFYIHQSLYDHSDVFDLITQFGFLFVMEVFSDLIHIFDHAY